MSKFCKYCGKELEDGAICSCGGGSQNDNIQQNINPAESLFGFIKAFFKSPVSKGISFVNNCNLKASFLFIGIQAILIGLFVISLLNKYNSLMRNIAMADGYDNYAQSILSTITFPLSTVFFVSAISSFVLSCIFAFVLMLIVKLFKSDTSYNYMLCAAAINSLTTIPFILIGIILSLAMPLNINLQLIDALETMPNINDIINPIIIPITVACLGNPLASYITLTILPGGSTSDKNKLPYIMFIVGILMILVAYFVNKIAISMCLPSALKIAYDSLSNGGIEAFVETMESFF